MSMPPRVMPSGGGPLLGPPGLGPPGLTGAGGMPPGGGLPGADEAYSALQNLTPRSQNPRAALSRIQEAIEMLASIARAIEPNVSQMSPDVAKLMIEIRQKAQLAKSKLVQQAPLQPPPDLMLGMGGAAQPGSPSMGAPALPGGLAGGGASPF